MSFATSGSFPASLIPAQKKSNREWQLSEFCRWYVRLGTTVFA